MRRWTLSLLGIAVVAMIAAACTSEKEVPVEVIKEVIVEKEIPVEKVVIKEVPVEKEVVKEVVVEKVLVATAVPVTASIAVEQAKYGGEAKVVSQASIKSLDITFSSAYVSLAVGLHMWDWLMGYDSNLNAKPQAVQSFEVSSDGLTTTFVLRPGMTFHNGEPVNTDRVIDSLSNRMTQDSRGKLLLTFSKDPFVSKIDDLAFTINLERPFGGFFDLMGLPSGRTAVIFPKQFTDLPHGQDVGEANLIGSGPYKLAKWEQGHKITLERFEDYVPRSDPGDFFAGGRTPYFDRVAWLEIPSEETKVAGLKTGEWDVVDLPSLDFYQDLKANPDLVVVVGKPGRISNVNFNSATAPTDNKGVRQAILAAVDGPKFMSALAESDLWIACPSVFFCNHAGASTAAEDKYSQNNLPLAKQLLADSGYAGEEFFLMNPNDYGTITPLGPVFKSMMEDIGITVNMPGMDWGTVATTFSDLTNLDWNGFTSWCEALFSQNPLFNCYIREDDYKHYHNDKMIGLKEAYAATFDPKEKTRLRDEMQILYYEDVPGVHFGEFFGIVPHTTRMKNLFAGLLVTFTNAWFEE